MCLLLRAPTNQAQFHHILVGHVFHLLWLFKLKVSHMRSGCFKGFMYQSSLPALLERWCRQVLAVNPQQSGLPPRIPPDWFAGGYPLRAAYTLTLAFRNITHIDGHLS
ncbi:hypothetical protein BaRGS_00012440 [Batillaria attramentaria]|uniref:Uncharacterized protein n=1 Tax=Batillaria attramentaria TaxID=370345 RepID=A0ABD0LAA5_9CAEN